MNINHKFDRVPAVAKSLNPKNAISAVRTKLAERKIHSMNDRNGIVLDRALARYNVLRDLGTFEGMTEVQIDTILDNLMECELMLDNRE